MRLAAPAIRVASIPSGHPYVRNVTGRAADLLPDPVPAGATDGRWWPPVMCDAAWVAAHRETFDVMHLHFGTESFSLPHLRALVRALRAAGRPLVHTVHDLENPQLYDQSAHAGQLDLLVPAADAVVTLTAGAAAEIKRRWGRTAEVIAHPHVLDLDHRAPLGTASEALVAGVHLRDLRPGTDAVGTVQKLLDAAGHLRTRGVAALARVFLNDRVRDEAAADRVTALVAAHPAAELHRGPRLDDAALARSIADLDVAVLPYRAGTHSGWVELCWDLGVPVAGPNVGYAGEQHPADFARFGTGAQLARAVERLTAAAPRPGSAGRAALVTARRRQRAAQADAVGAAHAALYRRLPAPVERAA